MTIFFSWTAEQDADFRAAYERITFEKIQAEPLVLTNGRRLVGSSCVTSDDLDVLIGQGLDIAYSPNLPDLGEVAGEE